MTELLESTSMGIVANVISIPAGLLALAVVANYAKDEGLLFEVKKEADLVASSGNS